MQQATIHSCSMLKMELHSQLPSIQELVWSFTSLKNMEKYGIRSLLLLNCQWLLITTPMKQQISACQADISLQYSQRQSLQLNSTSPLLMSVLSSEILMRLLTAKYHLSSLFLSSISKEIVSMLKLCQTIKSVPLCQLIYSTSKSQEIPRYQLVQLKLSISLLQNQLETWLLLLNVTLQLFLSSHKP